MKAQITRLTLLSFICALLLACAPTWAETPRVEDILGSAQPVALRVNPRVTENVRGWDYVANRLQEIGVPEETILRIYSDRRMPVYGHIPFSVRPREHPSIYARFTKPDQIAVARTFLNANQKHFQKAEHMYAVNRYVIASIMLIESNFGKNMGNSLVINRLSRLVGLATPENIEWNYQRLKPDDPTLELSELEERAAYLEKAFIHEIPALLEVAQRHKMDIFKIKGSIAGAIGVPQFLPSSYLQFAVDGNRDGKNSIFSPIDGIFSVGNYLESSGWKDSLSEEEKRKVIWKYNKSDEYINAVLQVADTLQQPPPKTVTPAKQRKSHSKKKRV